MGTVKQTTIKVTFLLLHGLTLLFVPSSAFPLGRTSSASVWTKPLSQCRAYCTATACRPATDLENDKAESDSCLDSCCSDIRIDHPPRDQETFHDLPPNKLRRLRRLAANGKVRKSIASRLPQGGKESQEHFLKHWSFSETGNAFSYKDDEEGEEIQPRVSEWASRAHGDAHLQPARRLRYADFVDDDLEDAMPLNLSPEGVHIYTENGKEDILLTFNGRVIGREEDM